MARDAKGRRTVLPYPPPDWRLLPWQQRVWDATENLAAPSVIRLVCGRGAGKDMLAIPAILRDGFKWLALQRERQANPATRLNLNPLVKIWVVAPSDDNLAQPWADWEGALRSLADAWAPLVGMDVGQHDWLFRKLERENKMFVLGTGQIELEARLTSTVGSMRGPGVDLVHYSESAIEKVTGQYRRAMLGELPGTTTRAGRLGRRWETTTPPVQGCQGGLWDECVRLFAGEVRIAWGDAGAGVRECGGAGEERAKCEVRSAKEEDGQDGRNGEQPSPLVLVDRQGDVQVGAERLRGMWRGAALLEGGRELYVHETWEANEFLTPEQREDIALEREADKELFEREREARWVDVTEAGLRVFQREWLVKNIQVRSAKGEARGRNVIVGMDFAREGDDATTAVAVDFDSGRMLRVEKHASTTTQEVIGIMERLDREFGGPEFQIDESTQQGWLRDALPRGLRVTGHKLHEKDKERLVLNLRFVLELGRAKIMDRDGQFESDLEREAVQSLWREMLAFRKKVTSTGWVTYGHPPGGHDDLVMAWAFAVDPIARALRGKMDKGKVRERLDGMGL